MSATWSSRSTTRTRRGRPAAGGSWSPAARARPSAPTPSPTSSCRSPSLGSAYLGGTNLLSRAARRAAVGAPAGRGRRAVAGVPQRPAAHAPPPASDGGRARLAGAGAGLRRRGAGRGRGRRRRPARLLGLARWRSLAPARGGRAVVDVRLAEGAAGRAGGAAAGEGRCVVRLRRPPGCGWPGTPAGRPRSSRSPCRRQRPRAAGSSASWCRADR